MDALLAVDIQNDFLPGGALAVSDGDQVIPVVNRLAGCFPLLLATQDWGPSIASRDRPVRLFPPNFKSNALVKSSERELIRELIATAAFLITEEDAPPGSPNSCGKRT